MNTSSDLLELPIDFVQSDFDQAGEQSVTGSVQVGSSGTVAKRL